MQDSKRESKEEGLSNAILESINIMTHSISELKREIYSLKDSKINPGNETVLSSRELVTTSILKNTVLEELFKTRADIHQKLAYYTENLEELNTDIQAMQEKIRGNDALAFELMPKIEELLSNKENLLSKIEILKRRLMEINKEIHGP